MFVIHRRKWESNIKMNGEEIQCESQLQDLVHIAVNFQFVIKGGEFPTSLSTMSF
jgi:hypothetical protein